MPDLPYTKHSSNKKQMTIQAHEVVIPLVKLQMEYMRRVTNEIGSMTPEELKQEFQFKYGFEAYETFAKQFID